MKKLLLLLTLLLWLPIAQADVDYWKSRAEQGEANAQYNLAWLYDNGQGIPKNYAEAFKWYRKAAKQGHAKAQTGLGIIYEEGKGVPKNYAKALKWYSKVAKQGNVDEQYKIAEWYFEGKGAPENNIYAYIWFSIADTNGSGDAKESIEVLTEDMSSEEIAKAQALATKCWDSKYQDCSETAQANTAFAKWQSLAAQGDAEAQYNLGDMYYKGQGVPQSYIYSYMWLSLAKANGVDKAQKIIETLSESFLSSEGIVKVQALAAKCWQSNYKDCF